MILDDTARDIAARAARAGGVIARARLGTPGYLRWKGHRDVTSEAALQVQEAIVGELHAAVPLAGILAEEGPDDAPVPVDADELWIVDPICGSLNFVQGIPYFGIAIAFRARGSIRASVVYDPCRNELFAATAEGPATLNGQQITVQQISEGLEAWNSAVIGTDWPYGADARRLTRTLVNVMIDQVNQCTVMGSPGLGLCNVAAGRLHAYWHVDLRIWDVAAAGLIVQRAGGALTDIQGMSWLHSDGGYIASNYVVQNSLLSCIQAVLPPSAARARSSIPALVREEPPTS
jgi:myo-inositol-1(or 4)-monophosphatase